jgi:PAS domain S-box-containing protein
MRLVKFAALALAVLGVLAVLVLQSQVRDSDDLNAGESARRLRELDARVDRAVLESHSGLSLNYDEQARTVREMLIAQRELEGAVAKIQDPALGVLAIEAREHLAEKERLVEAFASLNSVFQNSLAFFPMAAEHAAEASPRDAARDAGLRGVTELLIDVLRCRPDCSAEALDRIRSDVLGLANDALAHPQAERAPMNVLLKHARLFSTYAPSLDASIRSLVQLDGRAYDEIFVIARDRRERALRRANIFRAGLVALSIALLSALAAMIGRVRRNAAALSRALSSLADETLAVEEKQRQLSHLNGHLETRVEERTRELLTSREQYRVLLESTQAIPFEMEPDSLRFSYVGPQATTLLGHPTEDWTRSGFLLDGAHPDDRADLRSRLTDAATKDGQSETEFRMAAADGRWVWLRAFVTKHHDDRGLLVRRGLFLDVTARRSLEANLRAAQKLESVGRLASGIAHEINTPIQFVSDNVSFFAESFRALAALLSRYRDSFQSPELREAEIEAEVPYLLEDVPRALESSREGLERIATIVRAMKGFAHPEQQKKTDADLNANIQNTLTIARNEYKEVADLVTELGELPPVHCHAGEINQVLLNLVTNAAHAVADVVAQTGKRGRINVRSWRDEGDVVVSIRDTGFGIPPESREKLFEPFFTTKDVGVGTGQGLAIARSLVVDKHGGQITFDSEVGSGTEFRVRLPINGKASEHRAGSE